MSLMVSWWKQMSELKTKPTNVSVTTFLNSVTPEEKKKDCFEILSMMKKITGEEPVMWGTSIVGFGSYHYKYKTGHEGDMCLTGFSPRKNAITFYLMLMTNLENYQLLLSKLGTYKTGVGCLYIKRLSDVNKDVLYQLINEATNRLKNYTFS